MGNIEDVIAYSKKLKLLYVEDNDCARESTLNILEEFFSEVVTAINGEDALNHFSNDIDMIITDINMPKLNGLELIERIRDIDKEIPILVLSAYNESKYFMDSIKLGVDGYLLKPIDLDQFIIMVKKTTDKLKALEESKINYQFLKQYQEATNSSSIVSKTDTKGVITYANEEFCNISGYSKEELIGQSHNIIRHPENPPELYEELWKTIQNKQQTWKGFLKNISKDKKSYYVKTTIKPIIDHNGNITEYIAIRNDITDIMNPKKQLDETIKNAKSPVLVYMKIEEFNSLEEFYDNDTVEKIQDKISIYLEENLPKECKFDRIYKLGNGEYAMVNEKSNCMKDSDLFIQKLKEYQEKIKEDTISIEDIEYDMSLMISLSYDDARVLESAKLGVRELINRKQDFIIANNLAKKEQEKAEKNLQTISMVKKAINDLKIISYFQPIINNTTQKVEKYESLVRLVDEDGKVISPFFFLDIAKKGKYYSQITNMVLENSFQALYKTNMDISINLSALDIELQSTRQKLLALLKEHSQHTSRVVFELLEDENVKDFKLISSFISEVKSLGVQIAIDDFGAGYSNFERLLDYQPDILKIDGCLIRDIQTNNYSLSVLKTIVTFAKEQNIKIIAEFVENKEIFNILKVLGVDYSQGYYFGKPEALSTILDRK